MAINEQQFVEMQNLAESGNREAQYNLGWCYERGDFVEQNLDRALEWYNASAEQGFLEAKRALGDCYAMRQNWALAREWYESAAAGKHPQALFNLAQIYYCGNGVEPNPEQAKNYLKQAWATKNEDVRAMITQWCAEKALDLKQIM